MNIKQPILAERNVDDYSFLDIILYPQENTLYFYLFIWLCILLVYNYHIFHKADMEEKIYPWLFVPVIMSIWFIAFAYEQYSFPNSGGWAVIGLIPNLIMVLVTFLVVASILGRGRMIIKSIINKEIL